MERKTQIFVNQVGYPQNYTKTAYVQSEEDLSSKKFSVMNSEGEVVYSGDCGKKFCDEQAGDNYYKLDFTEVVNPGRYNIVLDGLTDGEQKSYSFSIADNAWNDLFQATLDYFTNSRCGKQKSHTIWNPESCHTGKAQIYGTDEYVDVQGGWHDAGDYGRYIVAGAKTVMDLLITYTKLPEYKAFDILDEARFELEWMLQMQREDGAVYHKVSCYRFCAFIMPSAEKDPIVLAPVSTTATATLAGTFAYAIKFYQDDQAFCEKLLAASNKAIEFLNTHEIMYYENPVDIRTGGYGDKNVEDELMFAYLSNGIVTKNKELLEKAFSYIDKVLFFGFGWGNFSGYAMEQVLDCKDLFTDEQIKVAEEKFIESAKKALSIAEKSSVDYALPWAFWGCTGGLMDACHTCLIAYKLTGKKEYLELAEKSVSFLLGANPSDYCYVTGFGTHCTEHPHHRPSGFLKKTMPGMLAGGPCGRLIDEDAKKYLQGLPPLKCYCDTTPSFSTNEIAIYWNSALTLIMAWLMNELKLV